MPATQRRVGHHIYRRHLFRFSPMDNNGCMQVSDSAGLGALDDMDPCQECAIMRSRGMSGFDIALHHIQAEIMSGHYVAGMQLPPERELAAKLTVGRGAVREAIRVLQAQGIVVSGTGPGNGTRIRTRPGHALSQMLQLHMALAGTSVSDMMQTRLIMEPTAVELAAQHATKTTLTRAQAIIDHMAECTDIAEFNELDTAFHMNLIDASGNHTLSMMSSAIRQTLATPIRRAELGLIGWDAFRTELMSQHHAIFHAVHDGNGTTAATLAREHIQYVCMGLQTDRICPDSVQLAPHPPSGSVPMHLGHMHKIRLREPTKPFVTGYDQEPANLSGLGRSS